MLWSNVLCFAEEFPVVTFREVLLDLMDLPGATYSCVADRISGTVLGEVGASSIAPGVVMEWGGAAAAFLATTGGDALDDLMITSHRSYHLVRPSAPDSRQWLMVYLCLDRGRSNLAAARRELASPTFHKRLAIASAGPGPHPPEPPPDPGLRRSVPAAMPSLRNGASPAVALLPATTNNGTRPGRSAPAEAEPAPVGAPGPPGAAVPGAGPGGDRRSGGRPGPPPAPAAVPLPRRAGPSRVPPPLPVEPGPIGEQLPAQSWATDVGTMRRLLGALRSLR
jgi:hypothetical protein